MAVKQYSYQNDRERAKQKPSKPVHQNTTQVPQGPGPLLQRARVAPDSLTSEEVLQLQSTIGNRAVGRLLAKISLAKEQTPNRTGLPDALKAGIENLSSYSMDDVRVHYNSSKPAELNALAYTQGTEIHVAPGQERHLAHEAWHVIQQKQRRVDPTLQIPGGVNVNDDVRLEKEADLMGANSLMMKSRQGKFFTEGQELISLELTRVAQKTGAEVVQRCLDLEDFIKSDKYTAPKGSRTATALKKHQISWYKKYLETEVNKKRESEEGGVEWQTEALRGIEGISSDSHPQDLQDLLNFIKKPRPDELKKEKKEPVDKAERKEEKKRNTHPALGQRFREYNKDLQYSRCIEYIQWVPAKALTISRCIESGNILDAVYHEDKAFWISDPKRYQVSHESSDVCMVYKLDEAVAKSLEEEYLICASGDYDEDNPEEYRGETAHPNHTLWKPNEIGAYGIGQARLKQLAPDIKILDVRDGYKGKSLKEKYKSKSE